jgi:hypothetical protein
MQDLSLTTSMATVIFVITCLCGVQYRRVWKAEGPRYQYWIYGICAAAGLLVLGFFPLETTP